MASLGITPEDVSLVGTFRNFLQNTGVNPNSILGSIAGRLRDPLFGSFALGQLSGNAPAANGNPQQFGSFLGQGLGQNIGNARTTLNNIANNIGGSQAAQSLLQGGAPGNTVGGQLEDLSRLALRSNLSGSVAGLFGDALINNVQGSFEQQLANAANGGALPNYAAVLRNQLGLGF